METLKSWALSVTAAAVITSVISFLSLSGNSEKTLKTVTALFLLVSFISPLTKSDLRLSSFSSGIEGVSEWLSENKLKSEVEEEVIEVLENEIISKISAYTEGEGYKKPSVDVDIKVTENYDISIRKIIITLYDECDISTVSEFVEREFNVIPEVMIKAEE